MTGPALVFLAAWLQAPAPGVSTPAPADPALEAAVARFYETQEREDIDGYLALWSTQAERPARDMLAYVFGSGDDRFLNIRITGVIAAGTRVRIRVEGERHRTAAPRPEEPPRTAVTRLLAALTFEKEGDAWKLVREGSLADDLASALLDAATPEAREALLAEDPELVGLPLLASMSRIGGTAVSRQDYARAYSVFEQLVALARRTGHRREEGEALQNLGNAAYYLQRFPEALAAYEHRLEVERERQDDAGVAAALAGIATIRYSLADYGVALARYREALALQERLDDRGAIATSLLSIGNITYIQGDFPEAVAAYARSRELSRGLLHADGEALALEGLGRAYTAQGDYVGAFDALDAVRTDPRMRPQRVRQATAAQLVGDLHFRLGNLEAARNSYDESLALFESLNDAANAGRVMQPAAMTELLRGRFRAAEALYEQSGATCDAAGDGECAANARVGFAFALSAQERYWEAAAAYRRGIDAFTTLGKTEHAARSEIGLSQALVGAGDAAGGIAAAVRARHAAIGSEDDDVLWRALTAEARAVDRLGDSARALGIARAAVAVLDRLEARALEKPGGSLPADAASAVATLAVFLARSGDAAGAFALSERLRQLGIRGGVAAGERDISRGMTPEERELERRAAADLGTRLAQLAREKGLPRPDRARLAELEKAVLAAAEARRAVMDGVFARLPDLRVWRGVYSPRSAVDAAPLLPDDATIIVSFVVDDDALLALIISRARPRPSAEESDAVREAPPGVSVETHIQTVRRRDLAQRVAALLEPEVLHDLRLWRRAAAELLSALPASAMERLAAASRVFLIPHDVLWRVPFDALPAGDAVLGDRTTISLGGSLEALLRTSSGAPARQTAVTSVLAAGAPHIDEGRVARLKQVAPGWPLRDTEAARAEIARVAGVHATGVARVLTGTAATERAIREGAGAAALLHLAVPFRINAASPLYSSLLTAAETPAPRVPAPADPETALPAPRPPPQDPGGRSDVQPAASSEGDGAIELREVVNMSAGAGVVVLSDGAAMRMRAGAASADVLGWTWLAAGVPSVLVARWSTVRSGERLLAEFHARLRDGAPASEALRAAQRAVRATPETAPPAFWAGWMLLGAR